MPKWAKKTLDVTSTVALIIFIVFVILLLGVRVFGIEPHIVLSGSMEPEILTGSMVYVDKLTPEQAQSLKVGDTVTYQVDQRGTKVTHRIYNVVGKIPIYELDEKGNPKLDEGGNPIIREYAKDESGYEIVMYTTYGINNVHDGDIENALDGDPEIGNLASSNVIGKVKFTIPFLGYLAHFVQNPPGKYVVLIGCVMLIFMTFFASGPADGEADGADATPEETEQTPEAQGDSPDVPKDVPEAQNDSPNAPKDGPEAQNDSASTPTDETQ